MSAWASLMTGLRKQSTTAFGVPVVYTSRDNTVTLSISGIIATPPGQEYIADSLSLFMKFDGADLAPLPDGPEEGDRVTLADGTSFVVTDPRLDAETMYAITLQRYDG